MIKPDRNASGIPELDQLLGGGFPRGAVILLAGSSGCGKTTLSFEWLFNGVKKYDEAGMYITFTEPLFKILKNLEGMSYYERDAIEDEKIKILDIRKTIIDSEIKEKQILDLIEKEVKEKNIQRLIIDSITAIAYNLEDKSRIRRFIFDLGTMLASLGCTSILTSEVIGGGYSVYGVEEFISDGIIKLRQEDVSFQPTRYLKIIKMRGIKYAPEENTFRISDKGIKIYPRPYIPLQYSSKKEKISTGIKGFDDMTHGGVFRGSTTLVAGSSGTGKSITGLHFIKKGLENNETCLIAGFEESREQIIRNAESFGWDFSEYEDKGLLNIMCSYPSEKYMEEHLGDISNAVEVNKVKRVLIDSISSIGNTFNDEPFRHFVKRLNGYLKSKEVTSIFTAATTSLMNVETLTQGNISTLTDNILLLKYVEAAGEINLMSSILKTRGCDHSKDLRRYNITSHGVIVGESYKGYEGVLSGSARKVSSTVVEQVKDEFIRNLGPMGEAEFTKLKNQGAINITDIVRYVDSLVSDRIISPEKADIFKGRIKIIFEGGVLPTEKDGMSDVDIIKLGVLR